MITILSAIGGAAAAKIAQGKDRRKEKDVQLHAEMQGTKQALSQERAKRLRAERKLAKLQADATVAEKQLTELHQEKVLLLQQLQVLQVPESHKQTAKVHETGGKGSPTSGPSKATKKMGFLRAQFASMQKRLKAVNEENEVLKRGMAAAEQEKLQLQEENLRLTSKASMLIQATEQLSQHQQELEEKLTAMSVEHNQALEQAALTQQLESRLHVLKSEVSDVFTALMNKQLTEEEVVSKLQRLGCVVRLLEPAATDRQPSSKLLVEAVPEDLPANTNGQMDPFQMSFVLEAPDKLRRLMSNSLSRTSSCSHSPTEASYRPPSMFSSRALPAPDTKVLDNHTTSEVAPHPSDDATPNEPPSQQLQIANGVAAAGSDKSGLSMQIADKSQKSSLQHQKSDHLNHGWSLKTASLHLPKFLTSSRSLERSRSDMQDSSLQKLTLPAGTENGHSGVLSDARDLVVSPAEQSR